MEGFGWDRKMKREIQPIRSQSARPKKQERLKIGNALLSRCWTNVKDASSSPRPPWKHKLSTVHYRNTFSKFRQHWEKGNDWSQTSFTLLKGVDTTSGAFLGVVMKKPDCVCTPIRYTFKNKHSKRRTLGNHDAIEEPVNNFSEQFSNIFS